MSTTLVLVKRALSPTAEFALPVLLPESAKSPKAEL
jgi:hypothetical protein